ncbi:uncharacterized protein LOC125869934 [Solanum stenotomum]|uniref:uncharacterized protein LOC125869934 n=1 Tax=Solanum stenotomum TaxID=172797 RepID=UPI0020D1EDD3|nr:uncharacterized protein LOC125869934 [Solanum stenotomum]
MEATRLLEEVHAGVYGPHMNRLTLAKKILQADNDANLNSHLMKEICEQFKITHQNSTAYRPQMNGVVEVANQNIKKILRKIIDNHRVYGTEAVIPAEVEIPSLRLIQEAKLSSVDWVRNRIEHLALSDEKRMTDVCHDQLYQQRMIRAFNKKVRSRTFEEGQLVLKHIFPHQDEYKEKFSPNWQGPYMVRKVLSGGALILSEMDDQEWPKPINSDVVKRYYI